MAAGVVRSLSVGSIPELVSNVCVDRAPPLEPQLLMYNDGTGCVLEFRPRGRSEDEFESSIPKGTQLREFPKVVARAVEKIVEVGNDVAAVCSRNITHVALGSVAFGVFCIAVRTISSFQLSSGGLPIILGDPQNVLDSGLY